ncbi:MAG: hypothetical protein ACJAWV_001056 [Flammeovirgaceae bacterium]|jgi:hypothetical protein
MLFFGNQLFAQLIQQPIRLHKNGLAELNTTYRTQEDSGVFVQLPFFDDFADFQTGFPDTSRWEQSGGAYINNSFGTNLISVGVASFDGQDEFGNPYNLESTGTTGEADRLTSHCFDLSDSSGNVISDSLVLSFYWQAQGLGELPNSGDLLELQFKNASGAWETQWFSDADSITPFIQERVVVDEPPFFHGKFQFRFVSIGRLSGAYDTWNLDYVFFDKKDSIGKSITQDFAVSIRPNPIFSDYSAIPLTHFETFPDSLMQDSLQAEARLGNRGVLIARDLFNKILVDGNEVYQDTKAFILSANNRRGFTSPIPKSIVRNEILNQANSKDSLVVETAIQINKEEFGNKVNTEKNDSTTFRTVLSNYYAYDDGSAELGVGVNKDRAKIAQQFTNFKADTIRYIDLYLAQLGGRSEGSFKLFVWQSIDTLGTSADVVLYESESFLPIAYSDSLNRFIRYDLEAFVPLPVGKFYIGIQQIANNSQNLMIGFDKNTNSKDKIFFNLANDWERNTAFEGSLMIRPVFEGVIITGKATDLETLKSISVFPNPTKTTLQLSGEANQVILYDLTGRMVYSQMLSNEIQHNLSLPNSLSEGIYILRIRKGEAIISRKVMIQK